MAHIRFDLALCSGLPRTRETAERVLAENSDARHLTIEEEIGITEIKGHAARFKSREELSARLTFESDQAAKPGATMFGGEVFADALERSSRALQRLLARPDWHTALVVAHEGTNRLLRGWMTGNGLSAIQAFEQDLACVNILDFDLVPREAGGSGSEIARSIIKAVNLTPYNYTKHGMNLRSIEAIFARQ